MTWFLYIVTLYIGMITARAAGLSKDEDEKIHSKQIIYSSLAMVFACYFSYDILWGWVGIIITIGIIGYNYNRGIDTAHFSRNYKIIKKD